MKKNQDNTTTRQKTQSIDSKNPQLNPRTAAAKVRDADYHLQMLKKRFQVLKGQEDYNRYRTLDQQKRIKLHQSLHESIKKDRNSLQKSLMKIRQSTQSQLKERHDQLKNQLLNSSKVSIEDLVTSKVSHKNKIKLQTIQNEQKIQRNKKQQLQQKAKIRDKVLEEQQKQKDSVKIQRQSRIKSTRSNLSKQTKKFHKQVQEKQRQIQRLMEYEKEMIKKASESISVNQKMKKQYQKVFVQVKDINGIKFPPIKSARNQLKEILTLSQKQKTTKNESWKDKSLYDL